MSIAVITLFYWIIRTKLNELPFHIQEIVTSNIKNNHLNLDIKTIRVSTISDKKENKYDFHFFAKEEGGKKNYAIYAIVNKKDNNWFFEYKSHRSRDKGPFDFMFPKYMVNTFLDLPISLRIMKLIGIISAVLTAIIAIYLTYYPITFIF